MDKYRWVVDRVTVGMELSGKASVIHPSLMRLGDGLLLLVGNSYGEDRFAAASYERMAAHSDDEGKTWTAPQPTFTDPLPDKPPTNVSRGFRLKSGRLWMLGGYGSTETDYGRLGRRPTEKTSPYGFAFEEITNGFADLSEQRPLISEDDGQTWQACEPIEHHQPGVIMRSAGTGVMETRDGQLLLAFDGFADEAAISNWHFCNGFVRSVDGGETWGDPTIVEPWDGQLFNFPNEMHIIDLPDGRWLALYRQQFFRDDYNSMGIFVYRAYSHDKGRTWTPGEQIFPNMAYTSATLLPDGAVLLVGAAYQGNIYAVSNNGGETWDYQNLLWGVDPRDGGDCGGYGIAVLDDAHVAVAYYAKADRAQCGSANEYGKMRIEIALLKKVRADSLEGRMR